MSIQAHPGAFAGKGVFVSGGIQGLSRATGGRPTSGCHGGFRLSIGS